MIKSAIEKILGLAIPELLEINGYTYCNQKLNMVQEPSPAGIETKTLTSLVDYIRNKIDDSEISSDTLIVHIISPTEVSLYSELRSDKCRENYMNCNAQIPAITYGRFQEAEPFNIMMQSMFVDNTDKALILKVVGNVQDSNVAEVGDNGTSQSVVIRTSVANVSNVMVPNPVLLAPYRTFAEINQPESNFIFRMQTGAKAALFEADGGAWKNEAMNSIASYLCEQLMDELHRVKILA